MARQGQTHEIRDTIRPGGGLLAVHAILCALLICAPVTAQVLLPSEGPSTKKECVLCHITWADGYPGVAGLLAPLGHELLLNGREARVSDEEMCWSCHNGYVADSRIRFLDGTDAHNKSYEDWTEHGDLPLDQSGDMYCGTCHTPHGQQMDAVYSFSPFMRSELRRSTLCLDCHGDNAGPGSNHPVHVKLEAALPVELEDSHVSADTLECYTCHRLHSPRRARLVEGFDRAPLCEACHEDQSIIRRTDHDLRTSLPDSVGPGGVAYGAADACAACHLMHGSRGKGLWARNLPAEADSSNPVVAGVDLRCVECHKKSAPGAEKAWRGHGHPLAQPVAECTEREALGLEDDQMSCLTCHDPHRWSRLEDQGVGIDNEEGTPLSSFLRLPDDDEGRLCAACHAKEAQALSSDHNAGTRAFAEYRAERPGQCTVCHNQHAERAFADGHRRATTSPTSSLCLDCHAGEPGAGGLARIGEHGHPLDRPLPAECGLPGYAGASADTLMGCESCHDPHVWSVTGEQWAGDGDDGGQGSSFLLADNRGAQLCALCHEKESAVIGSNHDLSWTGAAEIHASTAGGGNPPSDADTTGRNACSWCHASHGAAGERTMLALELGDGESGGLAEATLSWEPGSPEADQASWTPGARHCLACHSRDGWSTVVPEAWAHPQDVYTIQADGGQTGMRLITVDCGSCHDPHAALRKDQTLRRAGYLRLSSHEAICSDCHGHKALWKFGFYHDKLKRLRP